MQLCDNCEEISAALRCRECDELLCADCNFWTHKSKSKMAHKRDTLATRSRTPAACTARERSRVAAPLLPTHPLSVSRQLPLQATLAAAAEEEVDEGGVGLGMFSPVSHPSDLKRLADESSSDDELPLPLSERLGLGNGLYRPLRAKKPRPAAAEAEPAVSVVPAAAATSRRHPTHRLDLSSSSQDPCPASTAAATSRSSQRIVLVPGSYVDMCTLHDSRFLATCCST